MVEKSLAEQAYEIVEGMIVTLQLPPGTVFSEQELSQRIGIGRTPLREALQRLAADRLVTALPRRGMMVTEINISEHLAILETRRVLDRLIAGRAARRATPEQRDQLRQCAANLQSAALAGDLSEYMQRDREFDVIIGKAARNIFATTAVQPLHAHCRRFWYYYQSNGDLPRAADLHRELMHAVATGEEQQAEAVSDQLMDYLENFTKAALELP